MELTFLGKKQETRDVFTFYFKPPQKTEWEPGQFLIYFLKHENEDVRGKMRFFTISNPPFLENLSITTRINPQGSSFKKALMDLKEGDKIEARTPEGNFVVEDYSGKYVFIAGGIGITPFHSILSQLNHDGQNLDITLLYSNKGDDFVFKDEFDQIQKNLSNLKIKYILGRITKDTINENVKDIGNSIFYLSGPNSMVEGLAKVLEEMGIDQRQLRTDYFHGYD